MKRDLSFMKIIDTTDEEAVFSQIYEYLELQQHYEAAIKEVRTKLEILNDEFAVKHDHNPIHSLESRLKSTHSIINKLKHRGFQVSVASARQNLHDIAGIRVICCYIDDVYTVADMLTSQTDVTLIETKDYIKNPKVNGYRSLHLVLTIPIFLSSGPKDIPIEIQIRTVAMDMWASLEHELRYKTKNTIVHDANEDLFDCASTLALLDNRMQRLFHEANQPHTDDN